MAENTGREVESEEKEEQKESKSEIKSSGGTLTAGEVENIKNLMQKFWKDYGMNNDVSDWPKDSDGRKVIEYFESPRRNDSYFDKCIEYNKCKDKYQQEKGNGDHSYDEENVDFDRVQSDYDIAFFEVLSDFPKCFISNVNQHTMGYVMSAKKQGKSNGDILKDAKEKREKRHGMTDEERKKKAAEDKKKAKEEDSPEDKKKKSRFAWIVKFAGDKAQTTSTEKSSESSENERSTEVARTTSTEDYSRFIDESEEEIEMT